ncbi:uncharacterized protein LOC144435613 [Glandiceps talaboti]
MDEETKAYRIKGGIVMVVGLIMLVAGIFLVASLSSFFYYGCLLGFCGIAAIVIGGLLIKRSMTPNQTHAQALGITQQQQQQQQQSQGPTVITTTGTMATQYGGAPSGAPYSGGYGSAPPPAYGQYPGPPAAAGVGEGDFPPGLGPDGQQAQAGYSNYSPSGPGYAPNGPGYAPGGPGYGEPSQASPYGQPPPYSNYGGPPPGKM